MKIQFVNGPMAGTDRELQPPGVCIGREDDNDVQLLVAGVSRYHAKISFDGLAWSVTDVGSTNGTKVNQQKLEGSCILKPGDIIALGDQIILFGPGGDASLGTVSLKPFPQREPEPEVVPPPPVSVSAPSPEGPATKVPSPLGVPVTVQTETVKSGKDAVVPDLSTGIFGGKKNKSKGGDFQTDGDSGRGAASGGRKKLSNVIFYLLVFCAVLFLLALFVMLSSADSSKRNAADGGIAKKRPLPLMLSYERKKIVPDNVFRFSLYIADDFAEFTIDDLKYQRHFRKRIDKLPEKYVSELKSSLLESGFMDLKFEGNSASVGKVDAYNALTVVLDGKVHTVSIRNSFPPTTFEFAEKAVSDFAGHFDIRTDIMTVEDMNTEAKKIFSKAEQLFRNREGNPKNLQDAVKRYRLAMDYLEQFDPKPEEWIVSRSRLVEAKKILDKKISDLNFDINQAYQLKQYDSAAALCQNVLDMLDEDDPIYIKTKKIKLKMDVLRRPQKK